jgi:hypothetical protein
MPAKDRTPEEIAEVTGGDPEKIRAGRSAFSLDSDDET